MANSGHPISTLTEGGGGTVTMHVADGNLNSTDRHVNRLSSVGRVSYFGALLLSRMVLIYWPRCFAVGDIAIR